MTKWVNVVLLVYGALVVAGFGVLMHSGEEAAIHEHALAAFILPPYAVWRGVVNTPRAIFHSIKLLRSVVFTLFRHMKVSWDKRIERIQHSIFKAFQWTPERKTE